MILNFVLFWMMVFEASICLLLSLPFGKSISITVVRFLSTHFGGKDSIASTVFKVTSTLVTVMFLSDVHTVYKHHSSDTYLSDALRVRLVTAQRDMYISGFCLFLFLLLHLVYATTATNLTLEKKLHAMQKQAEGASKGYQSLLGEQEGLKQQRDKLQALLGADSNTSQDAASSLAKLLDENVELSKEIEVVRKAAKAAETQLDVVKKQAEAQSTAYLQLLDQQQKMDDAISKNKELEDELQALKKAMKDLETDREALKSQIQDYDFMFTEAKKAQ